MKQKFAQIEAKGLENLQQLLRETLDLTEQLQKNLDEISNCELEINIDPIKSPTS